MITLLQPQRAKHIQLGLLMHRVVIQICSDPVHSCDPTDQKILSIDTIDQPM